MDRDFSCPRGHRELGMTEWGASVHGVTEGLDMTEHTCTHMMCNIDSCSDTIRYLQLLPPNPGSQSGIMPVLNVSLVSFSLD